MISSTRSIIIYLKVDIIKQLLFLANNTVLINFKERVKFLKSQSMINYQNMRNLSISTKQTLQISNNIGTIQISFQKIPQTVHLQTVNIQNQQSNMQQLNELKNLVIQSLQSNGSLSNIRAQIRSSVFKVIDAQESNNPKKVSQFHWENLKVQKLMENPEGKEALSLIKEMMQFYNMDHSLNIFSSESNLKPDIKRDDLVNQLNLKGKAPSDKPLLLTVFQEALKNVPKQQKAAPSGDSKGKQGGFLKQKQVIKEAQNYLKGNPKKDDGVQKGSKAVASKQQIEEQILKNESNKFGVESDVYGESQGYDCSVDSLKLQNYDYVEDIKK